MDVDLECYGKHGNCLSIFCLVLFLLNLDQSGIVHISHMIERMRCRNKLKKVCEIKIGIQLENYIWENCKQSRFRYGFSKYHFEYDLKFYMESPPKKNTTKLIIIHRECRENSRFTMLHRRGILSEFDGLPFMLLLIKAAVFFSANEKQHPFSM